MKPRNKLQRMVVENLKKLPPLSDYQKKQVEKHVIPHIAKLNSKCEYTCMDCGKSWKGDKNNADIITCPHCSAKLTVEKDRKRKIAYKDYFAIVTRCGGFQIIRMFFMSATLRKGKKVTWWTDEAFQRWITSDGREVIVSRKRNWLCHYVDSWDWSSDLEVRLEHYAHSICPSKIIGRIYAIPELVRNGFNGDFHNYNPSNVVKNLLTNNRIETLWKAGQFQLARYFMSSSYSLDRYWSSIKIAIRNNYMVEDASIWCDLLSSLSYMEKDIRNPKFICPDNLNEAHDYWQQKRQTKEERVRRQQQRQREMDDENKYLSNTKQVLNDEQKYQKAKSKYFDLEFKDQEITVKPLTSIKEFIDEWHTMHHCVFTNKYYQKEHSLILHAIVNGVSIATIEMDIKNLEILQCRGVYNSVPPFKDRIITLIESNKHKIAQKRAA